jgi:hypothetical protein
MENQDPKGWIFKILIYQEAQVLKTLALFCKIPTLQPLLVLNSSNVYLIIFYFYIDTGILLLVE